jgi:hypothetical protein
MKLCWNVEYVLFTYTEFNHGRPESHSYLMNVPEGTTVRIIFTLRLGHCFERGQLGGLFPDRKEYLTQSSV